MPKSPSASGGGDVTATGSVVVSGENVFRFGVAVEFKELDQKGNFVSCPKDKNIFKLRCNIEKRIIIVVTQIEGSRQLKIERSDLSEDKIIILFLSLTYFENLQLFLLKLFYNFIELVFRILVELLVIILGWRYLFIKIISKICQYGPHLIRKIVLSARLCIG